MILNFPVGEQPVYANLNELNVQVSGQGGESDSDKTPTTRDPPFVPNGSNPKVKGGKVINTDINRKFVSQSFILYIM